MMGLSQSNRSGSDANKSSLLNIECCPVLSGTNTNTQITVNQVTYSHGSSFCQESIMKETAQGESNRTDGSVVFQAAGCGHALIDASPLLRQETQGIGDVPRDLSSSISSDFVQMFSLLQSIFKILLCIYKKILLFLPLLIQSKLGRTVVGVLLLAFFLGFKEILEVMIYSHLLKQIACTSMSIAIHCPPIAN
ncbi:hypothetical protein SO802_021911 [Lithocarpus litseifolius]|uniref:Uncharacterized protein n=1 Tax=Lithocarpus litseifolius TaxID=425828 RepID=A0AAW2CJK3_9ROSI